MPRLRHTIEGLLASQQADREYYNRPEVKARRLEQSRAYQAANRQKIRDRERALRRKRRREEFENQLAIELAAYIEQHGSTDEARAAAKELEQEKISQYERRSQAAEGRGQIHEW